jgi:predicted nuclease of predicted toxin-antitoxin system
MLREATDVRDIGLAGHKDPAILARAQAMDAVLVTADLEFANLLRFPLGSYAGIIVTRTPNRMAIR